MSGWFSRMDMSGLIAKAPGLLDALKSLGLTTEQVVLLSAEWTHQLRQDDNRDISDLLRELDGKGFVSRVDSHALARVVSADVSTVQKATSLVGNVVDGFDGDRRTLFRRLRRSDKAL